MANNALTIADMARDTGITPDTLRIWERRYGFPLPSRNQQNERTYNQEDLEKLRLIKQLIDSGQRPGKLAQLQVGELHEAANQIQQAPSFSDEVVELLACLIADKPDALSTQLDTLLKRHGLQKFLSEIVAPLNHAVGYSWSTGKIGILDEHRYAEQVRAILTQTLHALPCDQNYPRALLTTLPGEQHSLGLLMAACTLRQQGADILMLGVQTPLDEIVRGATKSQCQIVGLSCSVYASRHSIARQLVRLRKLLPDSITLWAGGGGVSGIPAMPKGIQLFDDLHPITAALQTFVT